MSPEQLPPYILPVAGPAIAWLLLEGGGLNAGWRWIHALAPVLARGSFDLPAPFDADAPLPDQRRGCVARWLSADELGWWDNRVGLGFRGAHHLRLTWGMGVMWTGHATLSEDRRTVIWRLRLRTAPLLLMVAAASSALMLWTTGIDQPLPLTLLATPLALFGGVYVVLALITRWMTRGAAQAIFGVPLVDDDGPAPNSAT